MNDVYGVEVEQDVWWRLSGDGQRGEWVGEGDVGDRHVAEAMNVVECEVYLWIVFAVLSW